MKKSLLTSLVVLLLSTLLLPAQTSKRPLGDAIVGEWINPAKDAKFKIFKKEEKYFGMVIWGTGGDSKDSKNPNPKLRNRDLVGLVLLKDFVFDGKNEWLNGSIYDPKDGKTYACKLRLASPNQLEVRGYVGISLFGRTEVWTKIN